MNLELKAQIVETNLDIVDINGFKFNLHKMRVGTFDSFKVLISIFDEVEVGDCIVTNDWMITRLGTCNKPVDLCVCVKSFELAVSEGFQVSKYLNGTIVGLFLRSDKCYLRNVGVQAKPFFMATLKVNDLTKNPYEMLIYAFGNQAKKLSTVKSKTILQCTVTVKQKKYMDGYEFAVIDIETIREEGQPKS